VIIPAAGSSQRLGQAKQLVTHSGKPLLRYIIELAATLRPLEIIVVTGAVAAKVQPVIEAAKRMVTQLTVVHNPNWESGIGSSISAGTSALNDKTQAVMVLLADQWKITADDLQVLQTAWHSNPQSLVASHTGNILGPPVIFPRDCFEALTKLKDDRGANSVVQNNIKRVIQVEICNAEADLDTPNDLKALQAAN